MKKEKIKPKTNPENRSVMTRIYKGSSKKKGNGNKFILTKYLFPIAKSEKKVKKKKNNKSNHFFNL